MLTEDFHKPMQVTDIWTPVMLALLIITYMAQRRRKDPLLQRMNEDLNHQASVVESDQKPYKTFFDHVKKRKGGQK